MLKPKEHFIPVGREKLLECLPGFENCSPTDQKNLKEFFELISSALHKQYHERQIRVQKIYEPLDPDSCLLYTSPSPRDLSTSRMPSSA